MGKKLFVGNLSFDTTSDDLQDLFAQIGTCESARVITDRDTGRSRGFGFVEMGSNGEASRAVTELNGREVGGRQINVSEAREPSGGGGGFGGGGRGRGGGGGGGGGGGYQGGGHRRF
jgi:RNA recognition motif-containing protein